MNEIGFEWSVRDNGSPAWKRHFQNLEIFYLENGHSNVPRGYPPNQQLAEFVVQQKQRHKKGLLKPDYLRRLMEIEFAGVE